MASQDILPPAVAGQFYSANPDELASMVQGFVDDAPEWDIDPKAIIAPHAGYVFSGAIAGSAYTLLRKKHQRRPVKRVILLGPAHRVPFQGLAVPEAQAMRTPLGDVPLDRQAVQRLQEQEGILRSNKPFLPEHSLDVQVPFLQTVLGKDFTLVPILCSDADPVQVDRALDRLWNGEETVVVVSSDLSHFHTYDKARSIDTTTTQAIETLQTDVITPQHACGSLPVNGLMQRARRLNMRATTLDMRNSGDTAGNKDRVVGYGSYAFEYLSHVHTPVEQQQMLRDVALEAIRHGLEHGRVPEIDVSQFPPPLRSLRATFVTLTLNGQLRGCIGSINPMRPLVADVAQNAYNAAFSDRRFQPLTEAELEQLSFKISLLGPLRAIPAGSEKEVLDSLEPDVDGLLIAGDRNRAVFLPEVWKSIPVPHAFLKALKQKAGMTPRQWPNSMKAYKYTTEVF